MYVSSLDSSEEYYLFVWLRLKSKVRKSPKEDLRYFSPPPSTRTQFFEEIKTTYKYYVLANQ